MKIGLSSVFISTAAFAIAAASARASVDYHGQTISGLNFTDSEYDAESFSNSDFSGVTAVGTTFSSSRTVRNFSGSNFEGSNLKDSLFSYSDLTGSNFSSSNLDGAYFISAHLAGVDFSGATIYDASFTNTVQFGFTAEQLYSTASYKSGNLQYVNLEFNDMGGWNFSGQDMTRANLSTSSVKNADFRNANLTSAIFDASDLSGADFRGSTGASWNASVTSNTILADGSVYGGAISLNGSSNSLIIRTSASLAVNMTASGSVSGGAELSFVGKHSSSDNALVRVSGENVSFDIGGAKLKVYLAEDFEGSSEIFLSLIEATGGAGIVAGELSRDDVSLLNSDGSIFGGAWDLQISDSGVGILVGVPEPAAAAALLGALALCIAARRSRN